MSRLIKRFDTDKLSFWLGGAIGLIIFIIIFGFGTLDVRYTDWLLLKSDLSQHYLGWEFFRKSEWLFPIGLTNSLAYPDTSSVMFTDSIPLISISLKLFNYILPDNFQFFGWYTLIMFFLQGAIGSLIIKKTTHNLYYAFFSSIIFVISPIFIWRCFTHTSLTSHFIILLCLLIFICYKNGIKKYPTRMITIWSLLAIISTTIHLYFTPIVFLFITAYIINDFISNKIAIRQLLCLIIPCIASFLSLYLCGGFSSDVTPPNTANSGGLGYFSANINALLNPIYDYNCEKSCSTFLHKPELFKLANSGQYEGFAFMGVGMMLCIVFVLLFFLLNKNYRKSVINIIKQRKSTTLILLFTSFVFFILSLSPTITFGNKTLANIQLPSIFLKVWSIFKSTGRFIWPVYYIILISTIYFIFLAHEQSPKKLAAIFALFCVFIQIVDLMPWTISESRRKIATLYYPSDYYNRINRIMNNKKHLEFCNDFDFANNNELLFLAHNNNLTVNVFYFSRALPAYSDIKVNKSLDNINLDSKDNIYIFSKKYFDTNTDRFQQLPHLIVDDRVIVYNN